jgi:uncharacterized protein
MSNSLVTIIIDLSCYGKRRQKYRMTKNFRRCVSCRKVALKTEFLRVVKCHPHNTVAIDRGNILLQGRSAYLCPTDDCLQSAQKKNRLGKALKAQVRDEIYQQLNLLK